MGTRKELPGIYLTMGGKIIKEIKLDDEQKLKDYKHIFDKLLTM